MVLPFLMPSFVTGVIITSGFSPVFANLFPLGKATSSYVSVVCSSLFWISMRLLIGLKLHNLKIIVEE